MRTAGAVTGTVHPSAVSDRGTCSCTRRSTTGPGSPIPRSSLTRSQSPQLVSGLGRSSPGRPGAAPSGFFAAHGIERIHRVLTDNGSCYRGKVFNDALGSAAHKFTKPYRPQTNGKVERYQRTLAREWAYRQAWASNDERAAALPGFLHRYNYHRPHTALKGLPPVHRTSTVTNLHGCNS